MSIIYFKRTGEIYTVVLGEEGLNIFGNNKEDFAMMLDVVILEEDMEVFWNANKFMVDISNKELIFIGNKTNYKTK